MAMKIDGGRTYIDKQEVVRRHIHSAVRSTIAGGCPVTNRLVIGAALNVVGNTAATAAHTASVSSTVGVDPPSE